jgi:hypothetical protein
MSEEYKSPALETDQESRDRHQEIANTYKLPQEEFDRLLKVPTASQTEFYAKAAISKMFDNIGMIKDYDVNEGKLWIGIGKKYESIIKVDYRFSNQQKKRLRRDWSLLCKKVRLKSDTWTQTFFVEKIYEEEV